ncbi:hypothetical protein VNO78_25037 [Psophocarpus tetragonolobus]|uniref:Uncharacterized protein n=1 Tax=Psophocarpus tetragonolobus TaxID=3891 RepID=A0AAN9XF22_PSOTE
MSLLSLASIPQIEVLFLYAFMWPLRMIKFKIEREKNIKNLAEHFTQMRSLLVSTTKRRHHDRDPKRRSAKYLLEPVVTSEVSGECRGEGRPRRCGGGLCKGV